MFDRRKAEMNPRESLKQKMIAAEAHQVVDITLEELAYIRSHNLTDLFKEVEQIRAVRQFGSKIGFEDYPKEEGLAAMAGAAMGEPDHKAHLDSQAQAETSRELTFEEVVKPLMKWLADNHCPHKHVVVSATSAELFGGLKSFNTVEFLKD